MEAFQTFRGFYHVTEAAGGGQPPPRLRVSSPETLVKVINLIPLIHCSVPLGAVVCVPRPYRHAMRARPLTQTHQAQSPVPSPRHPFSPLSPRKALYLSPIDLEPSLGIPLYIQYTSKGRIAYGTGLTPPPSTLCSLASLPPLSFEKYHAEISRGSTRPGKRSSHLAAGLSLPPHTTGDTRLAEQIHLGRAMRGG